MKIIPATVEKSPSGNRIECFILDKIVKTNTNLRIRLNIINRHDPSLNRNIHEVSAYLDFICQERESPAFQHLLGTVINKGNEPQLPYSHRLIPLDHKCYNRKENKIVSFMSNMNLQIVSNPYPYPTNQNAIGGHFFTRYVERPNSTVDYHKK